jgi:hypothetical protein
MMFIFPALARPADYDSDRTDDAPGRISAHSFRSGMISRRMLSCADDDRRTGDIDDDYQHHDGQDNQGRIAAQFLSIRSDLTSDFVLRRW